MTRTLGQLAELRRRWDRDAQDEPPAAGFEWIEDDDRALDARREEETNVSR